MTITVSPGCVIVARCIYARDSSPVYFAKLGYVLLNQLDVL